MDLEVRPTESPVANDTGKNQPPAETRFWGIPVSGKERRIWVIAFIVSLVAASLDIILPILLTPRYYGGTIPLFIFLNAFLYRRFPKSKYYLIMGGILVAEIVLALLLFLFATHAQWLYVAFALLFFALLLVFIIRSRYREKIKVQTKHEVIGRYVMIPATVALVADCLFIAAVIIRAVTVFFLSFV